MASIFAAEAHTVPLVHCIDLPFAHAVGSWRKRLQERTLFFFEVRTPGSPASRSGPGSVIAFIEFFAEHALKAVSAAGQNGSVPCHLKGADYPALDKAHACFDSVFVARAVDPAVIRLHAIVPAFCFDPWLNDPRNLINTTDESPGVVHEQGVWYTPEIRQGFRDTFYPGMLLFILEHLCEDYSAVGQCRYKHSVLMHFAVGIDPKKWITGEIDLHYVSWRVYKVSVPFRRCVVFAPAGVKPAEGRVGICCVAGRLSVSLPHELQSQMPVAVHLPGYQGPVRLDLSLRPAWGDPVLNVFVIEKQKLLRCEAGSFDSCRYLADETFGCTSSPVYLRVAGVPVKVLNDGPYNVHR